jgi:hypothetical protein
VLRSHRHVVDVAPSPVLARLEGLDNWMAGLLVMGGRVTVRRRVAASDVPAGQAEPQMYPAVPRRKALGTSLRSERVDRLQTDDVFACGGHVSRDYVPPSHLASPTPWPAPPRRSSGRAWHEPRLQRLSRMPRVNPDLSTIKDALSGSCGCRLGRPPLIRFAALLSATGGYCAGAVSAGRRAAAAARGSVPKRRPAAPQRRP